MLLDWHYRQNFYYYFCCLNCVFSVVTCETPGKMIPAEKQGWSSLLTETVNLFCQNGLRYQQEVKVEGLLVITLDSNDIIVVNVNNMHSGKNDKVFIHKDDFDKTGLVSNLGKPPQARSMTVVSQLHPLSEKAKEKYLYAPVTSVGATGNTHPAALTPTAAAKTVANTSIVTTTISLSSSGTSTSAKTPMRSLLSGLPSTPTMLQASTSTSVQKNTQPTPILQKMRPHSSSSGDHVTTKKIKVQYINGIVIVDELLDEIDDSQRASVYSDRLMSTSTPIANDDDDDLPAAKRMTSSSTGNIAVTPTRMVAKKSTTQRAKLVKRTMSVNPVIRTPEDENVKTDCVADSADQPGSPGGAVNSKNGEMDDKSDPAVSESENEKSVTESSDSEFFDPSFTPKSTKSKNLFMKPGFKVR